MNIVICDDRDTDALSAKNIIKETAQKLHIKTDFDIYSKADDVEQKILIKKEPVDILVLDIDMPEVSGLELSEKLRNENLNLIIIFLSAHEEFVFEAIEFQPFRYIRKMRIETEMPLAIRSAVRVVEANKDKQIILDTDNGEMKIMISEIMYYDADKHKTYVYLKRGVCIHAKQSIVELNQLINNNSFIMIHRSCVVNADYVKNIHNSIIVLDNDEQLIVSRPRNKDVKEKLLKLWGDTI